MLKFEGCKIDPKFENKSFLMQNFYLELDMKKSSDPKTLVFVSWALKTSLGQFGPKAFSKGLIKPSWEPKLQFSQTGPQFFKNQEKNPIKSWNLKKMSSPWDLETTFGPLGPIRRIQL